MMDNVQNCESYINIPSSQAQGSYLNCYVLGKFYRLLSSEYIIQCSNGRTTSLRYYILSLEWRGNFRGFRPLFSIFCLESPKVWRSMPLPSLCYCRFIVRCSDFTPFFNNPFPFYDYALRIVATGLWETALSTSLKDFMEYFGTVMSAHDDFKNTECIENNIKTCLHNRHKNNLTT
jgi:hypothetical protein